MKNIKHKKLLAVRTERERKRRYNRLENALKDRLHTRMKNNREKPDTETVA